MLRNIKFSESIRIVERFDIRHTSLLHFSKRCFNKYDWRTLAEGDTHVFGKLSVCIVYPKIEKIKTFQFVQCILGFINK